MAAAELRADSRAAILVALLAGFGIASGAASPGAPAGAPAAEARLRYLGSGGVSIRVGDDHVLTAPFFSNPGILRLLFRRIEPDEGRFPAWLDEVTHDAKILISGHSHYDHLMDVPPIARRLPTGAVLYTNRTGAHILAGDKELPLRVVAVNDSAGTHEKPGQWIQVPGSRVRIMAIRSSHAPHFMGVTWWDGAWGDDLDDLPRRARGWRMGQPHTFVIDFLEPAADRPRFRVFYQDSASREPEGFPPDLGDGRGFDLAILCVASFSKVERHPEGILDRLEPRAVLLTHWEDFFQPPQDPPEAVRGTDVDAFLERLERALPKGTPWWKPDPGETVTLPLVSP